MTAPPGITSSPRWFRDRVRTRTQASPVIRSELLDDLPAHERITSPWEHEAPVLRVRFPDPGVVAHPVG